MRNSLLNCVLQILILVVGAGSGDKKALNGGTNESMSLRMYRHIDVTELAIDAVVDAIVAFNEFLRHVSYGEVIEVRLQNFLLLVSQSRNGKNIFNF